MPLNKVKKNQTIYKKRKKVNLHDLWTRNTTTTILVFYKKSFSYQTKFKMYHSDIEKLMDLRMLTLCSLITFQ